jgi:hypothetical protein
VREVARDEAVHATRAVGKFGLGYALYRLCGERLGAEVQAGDWSEGLPPWNTERLYELILAGSPDLLGKIKSKGIGQAWALGTVTEDTLKLGEEKHTLASLHQAYKTGWRKHFALLA